MTDPGADFRQVVANKVFELRDNGFEMPIWCAAIDSVGSLTLVRYDNAGEEIQPTILGDIGQTDGIMALPLMLFFRDGFGRAAALQFNPPPIQANAPADESRN